MRARAYADAHKAHCLSGWKGHWYWSCVLFVFLLPLPFFHIILWITQSVAIVFLLISLSLCLCKKNVFKSHLANKVLLSIISLSPPHIVRCYHLSCSLIVRSGEFPHLSILVFSSAISFIKTHLIINCGAIIMCLLLYLRCARECVCVSLCVGLTTKKWAHCVLFTLFVCGLFLPQIPFLIDVTSSISRSIGGSAAVTSHVFPSLFFWQTDNCCFSFAPLVRIGICNKKKKEKKYILIVWYCVN